MRLGSIVGAGLLLCGLAGAAAGDTFDLDSGHSQTDFTVGHFGVSKVRGSLPDVAGTIEFDAADITRSTVDVTINTATLNSNNEARDKALRSPIFFYVDEYPEIRFVSTRIEKTSDAMFVTGDLTIRDVTKEVRFPFEMTGPLTDPFGNQRLGITATLTVDRRDFGMILDKTLPGGGLLVGNEALIEIAIEAVEAVEAESKSK